MKAKEYIKGGRALVSREKLAILKCTKPMQDAFAVIQDQNEVTVIAKESMISNFESIEAHLGWRIITFDMVLPFGLIGFMADISQALANEGIGIFVISAYSTDHILVQDDDLQKAIEVLRSLGMVVQDRD